MDWANSPSANPSNRDPSHRIALLLAVGLASLWLVACNASGGGGAGSGGMAISGGSSGSGGDGMGGSGGQSGVGSGGTTSSGGTTGSGGTTSTGGVTATGGTTSAGGRTGTGGRSTTSGSTGADGASTTGGTTAAGGSTGSGGRTANGGTTGTGGRGTGGAGTGGAGTGGASGGAGSGGGSAGECPASATLKAGDTKKTLTVGGLERTYTVHAPASYTGKTPVPVVFDFHGMGGDGAGWLRMSGWPKFADTKGFIAVYGDGTGKSWNAGSCCPSASTDKTDDVGFVKAMITALAADACIDLKRIYATGCSNGGAMSFRLACEAADVIAAVAPVDFDTALNPCKPSRPITEIQFRATNDSMVPYSGAEPNFTKWGGINQCTGTPAAMSNHPTCQQYPQCAEGAETILCTVQDGTHCGNYTSFKIPEVAWEVLQRHTLP